MENEYECKLEMFDKNSLYLLSDNEFIIQMKLMILGLRKIFIRYSIKLNVVEGTEVSSTAGWGALVGGITSLSVALVLLSQPGDNATPGTFISAFIYGGYY